MQFEEELAHKLNEINYTIDLNINKISSVGLYNGMAGISLYRYYYAVYSRKNQDLDKATAALNDCLNLTLTTINNKKFIYNELIELAWLFHHLHKKNLPNLTVLPLQQIDNALADVMTEKIEAGNIGFLNGGVGYLNYFYQQYISAKGGRRNYYITIIIKGLTALAAKADWLDDETLRWKNTFKNPDNNYDLGLPHGMMGIVGVFTKMVHHQPFYHYVKPLLNAAVKYVLQWADDCAPSVFPARLSTIKKYPVPSRVGWCTGDLGITTILLKYAQTINDTALEERTLTILKKTAMRRTYDACHVVDATLCHGAFGNAQVFGFIYKLTGLMIFKDAQLYWLQAAFRMAVTPDGFAGYKQWTHATKNGVNNLGLLNGICGMGLVILDFLQDNTLKWDACLLLNDAC